MSFQSPDNLDGALLERQLSVGDQQVGIERVELAQSIALRAHALRAVEAEQLRTGRFKTQSAIGAGVVGRIGRVADARTTPAIARLGRRRWQRPRPAGSTATTSVPCPSFKRLFDRFRQSRPHARLGDQAIDDHFDVVAHLAVQLQRVAQPHHAAVHASAGESLLAEVLEQVAVLAFLLSNQRGQHGEPGAFGQVPGCRPGSVRATGP